MKYAQLHSKNQLESLILGRNIAFGFSAVMFLHAYLEWNPLMKVDHINASVFSNGIFSMIVYLFGPQSEAILPLALGVVLFANAVVIQAVVYYKKQT